MHNHPLFCALAGSSCSAATTRTKARSRRRRGSILMSSSSSLSMVTLLCILLGVLTATMAFQIPFSSSSSSSSSFVLQQSCRQSRVLRPHNNKLLVTSSSSSTTTTRRFAVSSPLVDENCDNDDNVPKNVWETMASALVKHDSTDLTQVKRYYETISMLRVGIPALIWAAGARLVYPTAAMTLAMAIDDAGVFAVVSQDASQYIQNILTTSGLVFSLLAGQTYYFMYQQQEAIYLALFEEVTMAKSLLEQVSLVCQGRQNLYQKILQCVNEYVQADLSRFNSVEPAEMIAGRPMDDPLENILYLTSVGEPSIVYQTVRSLRQARAYRLGALQRKLPPIHTSLLYSLAAIVLFTFPLLGAGSQTIGGNGILVVQAWYLSFIVFGITLVMGVIEELQRPAEKGAYNAQTVLQVMICGLQQDLTARLQGELTSSQEGPSIDADGFEGYYRDPNDEYEMRE